MQGLKAYFIPTLNSGVTYWRMYLPVLAACRNKSFGAHLFRWMKDSNYNHPWQDHLRLPNERACVLGELEAGARSADILVMGVVHTPNGLTVMQGLRECFGKPVVVELDDNILSVPTYSAASDYYEPNHALRKIAVEQIREADALVVTTPYLKEVYSELNDNIYVVPNSIDFEVWGKVQHKTNKGRITVGWCGGATHDDDLDIIIPTIEKLTPKYKNLDFYFLHGASKKIRAMRNVKVNNKFERIDKYAAYVAKSGFDIGVAPLVDNAFNRAKSNLRWLEYSALGIPTVASNVGHFAESVKHGVTGLLCDTPEDFTTAVESLIVDTGKRKALAKAAKADVYENWNIDKVAVKYGEVLREIVDKGQVHKSMPCTKISNFKPEAQII